MNNPESKSGVETPAVGSGTLLGAVSRGSALSMLRETLKHIKEMDHIGAYVMLCGDILQVEREMKVLISALGKIASNDPEENRQRADGIAIEALYIAGYLDPQNKKVTNFGAEKTP